MRIVFWLIVFVGILLSFSSFGQQICDEVFSGQVLDRETNSPLEFVSVFLPNENMGTVTDVNGRFIIRDICSTEFNAHFSFVGYKSTNHHHDSYHDDLTVYLALDDRLLESVVVEGAPHQELKSASSQLLQQKEIERIQARSLGDLVSEVSGVHTISTGQNISKPVIHGLYGNRILIINDGVRHEFQSWGVEHAPEIDPSQIENIQVIKGAATVRYGPDALGGVLLIQPRDLALNSSFNSVVGSNIHTNGRALASSVQIREGFDHVSYSAEGSWTRQGDLKAPDYFLTNTGKKEYSYSGGLRWHQNRMDFQTRYSRFNQKLGILRGSVNGNLTDLVQAISSEPPPETRSFSYGIRQPNQWVDHQLMSLKGAYLLDNQSFTIQVAYQTNHRQEYDIRRGSATRTPNIDLQLNTRSANIDWMHPTLGRWEGQAGIQWQYQDNNNLPGTRTAQFIPNFNYFRMGVYLIESLDLEYVQLEAGIRFDYHSTNARGVFQQQRYGNYLEYQNVTYTLGLLRSISSTSKIRFNIGSSWRPPNVAELYGFGRHQSVYEYGFWTYDYSDSGVPVTASIVLNQSDRKVSIEKGYKTTVSLEKHSGFLQMETTGYVNYIKNYIFSKPAGITNTVRGAFPFFIFDQTNALLWGVDASVHLSHSETIRSRITGSYLWAGDIQNHDKFIGLPPADLRYVLQKDFSFAKVGLLSLDIGANYTFRQFQAPRTLLAATILDASAKDENLFAENDKNFDLLSPPPGFFLLKFGAEIEWKNWSVNVQIRNALNQSYRNYTNRLRYYADEVGRDIGVTLRWKLD